VFVPASLVQSQCPCRDVGGAIPVASLRLIKTAHGGLECSFMKWTAALSRLSSGPVMPHFAVVRASMVYREVSHL
jgi:hypothetical protein